MKFRILNYQNLYYYTFLNYLDKGLNFLIPLIILKIIPRNSTLYSDIEYLISISLIISSFLDIGLRSYLFYGFRNAINKNAFLEYANLLLSFLIGAYTLVLIVSIPFLTNNWLFVFIGFRTIYLTYTYIKASILRLEDKPSTIFLYTSLLSILISIIIVISVFLNIEYNLIGYSIPYIIFCLVISIIFISKSNAINQNRKRLLLMLNNSIKFAWPLMLTLVLSTFQNNFAKIYGYNRLTQSEFESFAILLRIFMILFLSHTSAIAFYTKSIYMGPNGFDIKIYTRYLAIIGLGFLAMILFVYISNRFQILSQIKWDVNFLVLLLTYIFMMNRNYLEQYFGKYHQLKYLIISTSLGFVSFLLLFIVFTMIAISITKVLIAILASEFISFLIVAFFYQKRIYPIIASVPFK